MEVLLALRHTYQTVVMVFELHYRRQEKNRQQQQINYIP